MTVAGANQAKQYCEQTGNFCKVFHITNNCVYLFYAEQQGNVTVRLGN